MNEAASHVTDTMYYPEAAVKAVREVVNRWEWLPRETELYSRVYVLVASPFFQKNREQRHMCILQEVLCKQYLNCRMPKLQVNIAKVSSLLQSTWLGLFLHCRNRPLLIM